MGDVGRSWGDMEEIWGRYREDMGEIWYLGQAAAVQVERRGERGVATVGQRRNNQAADVAKVLVAVETGRVGLSHLVRVRARAKVRE